MSEQSRDHDSDVPTQAEPDMMTLIKKMQQQLVNLERKIDLLIHKPQERSFQGKSFSKPFRPSYSSSRYYGKGDQGRSFRDNDSIQRSHYGRKDQSRSFKESDNAQGNHYGKKDQSRSFRENDQAQGQGHSFKKHRDDDQSQKFNPKKKPFYMKRKDRD
jgi:hypothetical protein